jgi:hypothetical protein
MVLSSINYDKISSSSTIEKMMSLKPQDPHTGVAYFYCSFNDSASQDPLNVLGSFAAQLYEAKPELWSYFNIQFQRTKKIPKRLDLYELEVSLARQFQSFLRIFLFLDAPNESVHASTMLSSLRKLIKNHQNVHLFVSSTPYNSLAQMICDFPRCVKVTTEPEIIRSDISNLVGANLRENPKLRALSTKLKDDIRMALIRDSDGM